MTRTLLFLAGVPAALPLLVLLLLLPGTPITLPGALYLSGYFLIVSGLLGAPWWDRYATRLLLLGALLILVPVTVRIAAPPSGSRFVLTTLPGGGAPRWSDRIFDEQDIVLFGARAASRAGLISAREAVGLFPALSASYSAMKVQGVTPLSPFLATYLNRQGPLVFDALVADPPGDQAHRSSIIFLHGFGGNFTLQCWLMVQAGERAGALTVCPSTGPHGKWWEPRGATILQETISYLRQRGVERIYLAGLSNGGIGGSHLAPRFTSDLAGLIFISGADPAATVTELPLLVVQGENDERIPARYVEQYVAAAGEAATYLLLDGDHFLLLKQAARVQSAIAEWIIEQERSSSEEGEDSLLLTSPATPAPPAVRDTPRSGTPPP